MAFSCLARTKPGARGSAVSCLSDRAAHHSSKQCTVAVVGGGAAGLAAAKELQEEGHKVEVFEKSHSIGGVWVLDDRVESDLLGQSEGRNIVHSSLYESLRVNLPREAMSFSDYPFLPEFMKGRSQDTRRFPHHVEVRRYLEAYAEHFDLQNVVNLGTEVLSVVPVPSSDSTSVSSLQGSGSRTSLSSLSNTNGLVSWKVTSASADADGTNAAGVEPSEQVYDAVMICNGHYTTPRLPPVEGIDQFPGGCEHSHNYRRPGPYKGLKVLLVGAHASGEDIAWELASCAREVVLCAKTWMTEEHSAQVKPFGPYGNMYRRKWVQELRDDGSVLLEDGTSVENVDVVMFCTGYHYSMPFLQEDIVDTTRSHVRPLYQHLMTQEYGPSLSFIGLPFKIIPFPQFELQCKYVARMLSGRVEAPASEEMEAWIHAHYKFAEQTGMEDRHLHLQSDAQWDYNAWLAEQCGPDVERVEEWRVDLWRIVRRLKKSHENDVYRDIWDDPEAGERAQAALTDRFAELNKVPAKVNV